MDNDSFRNSGNPLWLDDQELRNLLDSETTDDIVKRVSDDFATELANIVNGAYKAGPAKNVGNGE